MEKRRSLFVLILILLLSVTCNKSSSREENKIDTGGRLNVILYIDPLKDCISCTLKGLSVVDMTVAKNEKISIFLRMDENKEEVDNFKTFIKEKFPKREFSFSEYDLKFMHPSILLVRDEYIYMSYYIPNDPGIMNENADLAIRLLTNLANNAQ